MIAEKLLRAPMQIAALLRHPANSGRKGAALRRWLSWQIGSRLAPGPVATPFVDDLMMLMSPGLAGATGAIHFGLAEYEDMAFALHLLRAGDLFADVGANVGAYSLLAAAAGADVVAIEPVAAAAAQFSRNMRLNDLADRVALHRVAAGAAAGEAIMTQTHDAMNHIAVRGEKGDAVPVVTLDSLLGARGATLLKIDVEGFERDVLLGARATLMHSDLLAVIIEINGAHEAYGHSRDNVETPLREAGFSSYVYTPHNRELSPGVGVGGNVIFVRHLSAVRSRLSSARRFRTMAGQV